MLKMDQTDLAVLSACESGIGERKSGMEYSSLANQFANKHCPCVVATLWCVNDDASRRLITEFYKGMKRGDDSVTALANAQRIMIRGDATFRSPGFWAGYFIMGKPVSPLSPD
jgi:CHAT domain-containing protein